MLSITAKVRTLVKELDVMIHLCSDLIGTLKDCSSQELSDKIGVFAREMPECKILTSERKDAIDLVRMVCTKEIAVEKAIKLVESARSELVDTRSLIKL